ncbi:MAG: TetR/AcrR family transcriptional regulator [Acidimicrobiales bacterium]
MAPRTAPNPTASPATKGELTRQTILDAAIARFGRDGYRATSVADIARDASVGGTVAYAYFADKEALFFAALDEDAAEAIGEGLSGAFAELDLSDWRENLLVHLLGALDHHPLARRLLAGLEPDVTARVLEMPALNELRKVCAERLAADQLAGVVRADLDPYAIANGIVAILLSLLMSVVQLGTDAAGPYTSDVVAVFEAALMPVRRPG